MSTRNQRKYALNHQAAIERIDMLEAAESRVRGLHYYVIDFCDEYVCANCGQNPCPTLAALDAGKQNVT